MTTPSPEGGHGKPYGATGTDQSPSTAMRELTFDTQEQADDGAEQMAAATAHSVLWRGLSCGVNGITLGGHEVVDGYVAGVSIEVRTGQNRIDLIARSTRRSGATYVGSSTTAPARSVVPVSDDGCPNPELARAIAGAAAG
jgi:hypothetical protein